MKSLLILFVGLGENPNYAKQAQNKARWAESLYQEKELSIKEIYDYLSISKPTLDRYLRHRKVAIG